MLSVKNVTKIYQTEKSHNDVVALNDVSIDFPETGFVFLLGKSGSGKSTLLNVIGGLDVFDKGEIVIKGNLLKPLPKVILIVIEIHLLDLFSKNITFWKTLQLLKTLHLRLSFKVKKQKKKK